MFSELIKEQQGLIAVEKLSGNIVKEVFHKGALFGLRLAESVVECLPLEKVREMVEFCPKCGTENNDNWPVEVDGEIVEGGCQECWEKQTDQEWWKMIAGERNCCSKERG